MIRKRELYVLLGAALALVGVALIITGAVALSPVGRFIVYLLDD